MSDLKDPMKPISRFLKGAILLLFLVASISLFIYSTSKTHIPFFECDDMTQESLVDWALNNTANEIFTDYLADDPLATNISHIFFGIGGSAATWHDRRHYAESWWRKNVTRGFVWLDKRVDQWPESSPPYQVSEDWSRFKYTSSDSAVRIARIVIEAFRVRLPGVRWFVMGDDDTVFFTDNLVSVLSRYDHREMYYIGGNSESTEQNVIHSYGMAFGGAGFAISYPLAAALAKKLDGCLERYYEFYGSDQRIWACISEIGVSLTIEPGFHQIDLREDIYGLLAAHPRAPLVSLHHLDYVKPLFPGRTQTKSLQTLVQASHVDSPQTLQQTLCYDFTRNWSVSISWGYTAQIYTSILTPLDLATPQQTFKAWRNWGDGPFSFNTRPVSKIPSEQPIVYFLEKVKEVAKGWTLTTYNMNVVEYGKKHNKDGMTVKRIAVLSPKMDPRELKMVMDVKKRHSTYNRGDPTLVVGSQNALRRRCCKIEGLKKKSMLVKTMRCKPGETVTF